jgi:hypothetical protein
MKRTTIDALLVVLRGTARASACSPGLFAFTRITGAARCGNVACAVL